ncbi:hypothetical protein J4Q44_G00345350 [Coregonus suidteri]|uniref:IF rod domain-containing protein n=1 Tax=Coregonus suidteri TaxID=861788 RepID=A0AAN8Q8I0_9TELE
MDAWYKSKFQDLNDVTTKHVQSVRSVREEIASYKRDSLNLVRELESMKTRNESLKVQIRDAVERHKKEQETLLERIEGLKLELKVMKEKIALLLREYQELLNVKMAWRLRSPPTGR